MRTFARTIGAFLCALGCACGQAAQLRIALGAEVTSMDPQSLNIAPNNDVAWQVFDALTHVDDEGRLVPGLALSWRAIDPTTWEFRLRPGVKFHNGDDFTARDVAFSIERAARLPNGQFAGFVKRIVSVQIVNPLTLRLRTAAPYAVLPYDLDSIFIVSHRAAANATSADFDSGRAAVGTGPFRLVRFVRGDRVELARNDAYWGGRAPWERVVLRIVPNDAARLTALLAGDVDMIESVPTADAARLKNDPRFSVVARVSWRTIFFFLDQRRDRPPLVTDASGQPLDRNPFKDLRVRRAISKAIDRAAIAAKIMDGFALPAANLVSPPVIGYAQALVPERYDPEGARRLLAEAGYPHGFGLTLAATSDRYANDAQIAQAVAQMLTRVGVRTRVAAMPVSVYLSKARRGEFSFGMLGWGSFAGDLALRTLLATPDPARGTGTWNFGGYSNPEADALLERALAATDNARREALAQAAAVRMLGDLGVIPLHHQFALWALRRGLAYPGRTDEYTFAREVTVR